MAEEHDSGISPQESESTEEAQHCRAEDLPRGTLAERLANQKIQRDSVISLLKNETDKDQIKRLNKRLEYWNLGVRYYETLINESSK